MSNTSEPTKKDGSAGLAAVTGMFFAALAFALASPDLGLLGMNCLLCSITLAILKR
jgi:hypothetical protein